MGALLTRFKQRFAAEKSEPLRDWSDTLRLNAAAARLAPFLYVAHHEVIHGCDPQPWLSLHPAIRHGWTQRAAYAIRTVR